MQVFEGIVIGLLIGFPAGAAIYRIYAKGVAAKLAATVSELSKKA